jgi:hypothetical protein
LKYQIKTNKAMDKPMQTRLLQLCVVMLNEQSVYVKGSFLKQEFPDEIYTDDEMCEVLIESVNVGHTVNLFYDDGLDFCITICDVNEKHIYLTKE